MSCAICINDANMKTMYNDCIIESLEKIKFHYMSLKSKLCENEQLTNDLKQENDKFKKIIKNYEELENNQTKKRRTASCEDSNESDVSFSQNVPKCFVQKSKDDLNMALNFDDEEFDLSFIPSTQQVECERKKLTSKATSSVKTSVAREPLKALPTKTQLETKPQTVKQEPANIKQEPKLKDQNDKACDKSISVNKSSSWISKENELKKSALGSIQKKPSRSLRHFKQEHKIVNMSLKSGKLRQTRLQLDKSKNLSSNFSDTTFCDEAIEASPNADMSLKRTNVSKQWQLRNISSKIIKPEEDDSNLSFTNLSPKKSNSPKSPKNKELETSSVVMFTPASQDIIFLDDSSDSFNIESMDLLKDLMNPTESLSNLKRIESNGIKMLQKINGSVNTAYSSNNCSDFDEKPNLKTAKKIDHEFARPKDVDVKIESNNHSSNDKENFDSGESTKSHKFPTKTVKSECSRKRFEIDCQECQTYIKYLGARLTDEQIEQHIRNCTNHKKPLDENLTPDGFWDPMIKPFDPNDPRNATLIDDPFLKK